MKIAVGSTNPAKVSAVKTTILRVWPAATVVPVAVPSGVSHMPLSDAEALSGARNRAIAARDRLSADYGVGLEGGVHQAGYGLVLLGWVSLVDRHGREGIGGGARLPLPQAIARRIVAGEELGPIMDEIMGEHNTKQKGGAVGALTQGLVRRSDVFAMAVAYAMAPFICSLYES